MVWVIVVGASASLVQGYRPTQQGRQVVDNRPISVRDEGYVSSRSCRACHPHQYATWHASYHRTMTQVASPQSVLGDFDNVRLTGNSHTYQLGRQGDQFWIEMDEPVLSGSGEMDLILDDEEPVEGRTKAKSSRVQRPIVMTTGSHHYQVYWWPTGNGRKVENLPFIYLLNERRWIPRGAAFLKPPVDGGHEQPGRWNIDCNRCHATHARPRIDRPARLDLATADTIVAELGIACEACHGPGERHVRINGDPLCRYQSHFSDAPDRSIVQPARLSPRKSSQVCGHCHSVNAFYSQTDAENWVQHGFRYRPGDELERTRHVVRPNDDRNKAARKAIRHMDPNFMNDHFWPDGMVRISGREFNGLVETVCHQRGELSCLSCHSMHKAPEDPRTLVQWADDQLTHGMEGNQACLQCHKMSADRIADHTHHAPASSGSLCYNCHMLHTTYGLLKGIRSHHIDSPRVDVTLKTGRPNACNLCHLDQTLDWTAERLAQWYGQSIPALTDDQRTIAASLLWLLQGDAGQRALLAWSMGWQPARDVSGSKWMSPFLAQLLDDPYDAVRFIAHRSLCEQPEFRKIEYDFVGPPEERTAAKRLVLQVCHSSAISVDRLKGDRVLMNRDGHVRGEVQERLVRHQNDVRVHLKE